MIPFWRQFADWTRYSRWSSPHERYSTERIIFNDGFGWREPTVVEWMMVRACSRFDGIAADTKRELDTLLAETRRRIRAIEANSETRASAQG